MRRFYTELIGLEETFYDAERNWLTYQSGDLQIVYMQATSPRPVGKVWAKNPGYKDSGTDESLSWVITVDSAAFDTILERLKAAQAPLLSDPQEPQPGHKQIMTRDPMGTCIEIYSAPEA